MTSRTCTDVYDMMCRVWTASQFVGNQLGKSVVTYVLMCIALIGGLIMASYLRYDDIRDKVAMVVLGAFGVSFFVKLFMNDIGHRVTTDGKQLVTRPFAFAVWDFAMLIIYVIAGFIAAVVSFFSHFRYVYGDHHHHAQ